MRDRLWFFTLGPLRGSSSTAGHAARRPACQADVQNDTNKRGEIKLTGTVAQNHTMQGGYLNNPRTVTNNSAPSAFDHRSEQRGHSQQARTGTTTPTTAACSAGEPAGRGAVFAAPVRVHRRRRHQHATSSTRRSLAPAVPCLYNAPYFDATDPEHRNNRQITGSVTELLERSAARHETKGGYELFRSQRTGGNSQSSTSYVFNTDFVTDAAGAPVLDAHRPADSDVRARDVARSTSTRRSRGATLNIDNNSLYVQDHWTINGRLSADLGARFEHVKALSTGDDRQRQHQPHRAAPRRRLRHPGQRRPHRPRHLRPVLRPLQRGADRRQQPGRQPAPTSTPIYPGPAGQGSASRRASISPTIRSPRPTRPCCDADRSNIFMDPRISSRR